MSNVQCDRNEIKSPVAHQSKTYQRKTVQLCILQAAVHYLRLQESPWEDKETLQTG